MKALADNKNNVSKELKFDLGRVENFVVKGKKCWFTAFFAFFHSVFKSFPSEGLYKLGPCGKGLASHINFVLEFARDWSVPFYTVASLSKLGL